MAAATAASSSNTRSTAWGLSDAVQSKIQALAEASLDSHSLTRLVAITTLAIAAIEQVPREQQIELKAYFRKMPAQQKAQLKTNLVFLKSQGLGIPSKLEALVHQFSRRELAVQGFGWDKIKMSAGEERQLATLIEFFPFFPDAEMVLCNAIATQAQPPRTAQEVLRFVRQTLLSLAGSYLAQSNMFRRNLTEGELDASQCASIALPGAGIAEPGKVTAKYLVFDLETFLAHPACMGLTQMEVLGVRLTVLEQEFIAHLRLKGLYTALEAADPGQGWADLAVEFHPEKILDSELIRGANEAADEKDQLRKELAELESSYQALLREGMGAAELAVSSDIAESVLVPASWKQVFMPIVHIEDPAPISKKLHESTAHLLDRMAALSKTPYQHYQERFQVLQEEGIARAVSCVRNPETSLMDLALNLAETRAKQAWDCYQHPAKAFGKPRTSFQPWATDLAYNAVYESYAERVAELASQLEDGELYGSIDGKPLLLTTYVSPERPSNKITIALTGKGTVLHTPEASFPKIKEHLEKLYVGLRADRELSVFELQRGLGEMVWWLAHGCFFERGSAHITKSCVEAFLKERGLAVRWLKHPDLEALVEPKLEAFVESFAEIADIQRL